MELFLERVGANGDASRLAIGTGLQRVKVDVGDRFRLVDAHGVTPDGVVVRRFDSHLLVDGPQGVEVELSEFYARCSVSSPCSLDLQPAAEAPVSITPASAPIGALTDGSFVLHPAGVGPGPSAPVHEADAGGFGTGWLVGGIALGALAIGGAAGGGSGEGGAPVVAADPGGLAPIDLTPPPLPKLTSRQASASGLPTIEGEAEPGTQLTVSFDIDRDGVQDVVYTAGADADGRWAVDLAKDVPVRGVLPAGGLPDGTIAVGIVAIDAASNASEVATFDLLIDSSAPGTVRIVSIYDDVPGRVGAVADGAITNDLSPTLSGTLDRPLEDGGRLEIVRDGRVVAAVDVASGATTWSFTDQGLSYGNTYAYGAFAVDALGNRGEAGNAWHIVTDRATSKTASITGGVDDVPQKTGAIAGNGTTNDSTPTITGRLSAALDAHETLQVWRDGTLTTLAPTLAGATFSVTDGRLADGVHAYTVRVVDAEGAGAMSAAFRFTVDTVNTKVAGISTITDNALPGVGVVRTNGSTNDTTPTLSGTLSAALAAGESIEILRNDVVVRTLSSVGGKAWSWTDSGLVAGSTYAYSVRVVDAAGNLGKESADYVIRLPAALAAGDLLGAGSPSAPAGLEASAAATHDAAVGIGPVVVTLPLPGSIDSLLEPGVA